MRLHREKGEYYLELSKGGAYGVIQISPSELELYLNLGWVQAQEKEFIEQDESIVEEMEKEAREDLHSSGPATIARFEYIERLLKDLAS